MSISSPHLQSDTSVTSVMLHVAYALVPGIAVYSWLFGPAVLVHIALACLTAIVAEGLVLILRKRAVLSTLYDGSALITAILLAISIPPIAPWWITVLGVSFAIIFGKQLYGGLGYNPFNPAMLGYAMLLISFPLEMTLWPSALALIDTPLSLSDSIMMIFNKGVSLDAITAATPFDAIKTELRLGVDVASTMQGEKYRDIFGALAGTGWEKVSLAFLAGGLYLLFSRRIAWQIPVTMLLTIGGLATLFYLLDPSQYASPWLHLFGGASMLGAFFIATDPVSASTTPRGRILYAAGIGIIVYVIRNWGGYPEGLAFAVLLMNMAAPTIDHYTQPRVFGGKQT